MLNDTRIDRGDDHQRTLFNFVTYKDTSRLPDSISLTAKTKEMLDLRRRVQSRMAADGYVLQESGQYSPADLAGMDYVLYSLKKNRFFFIDVTTDVVVKWQLPELRKKNVFRIGLDDNRAITDDTRVRLLERLLALMDGPELFPISTCGFPSLDGTLSEVETQAELVQFRTRIQSLMRSIRQLSLEAPEKGSMRASKIELLREYWLDLNRLIKFAGEEHVRRTDPEHLRRQQIFVLWARSAAPQAIRATINDTDYPYREGGHSARYDARLDQIDLCFRGEKFKLFNVTRLLAAASKDVWEKKIKGLSKKNKIMTDVHRKQKALVNSGSGLLQSAEFLARLMEATPLVTLIGPPAPVVEKVVVKFEPIGKVPTATPASESTAAAAASSGRPILTLRKKS